MKSEVEKYSRILHRLDFLYASTGYRLTAKKPKSVLSGFFSDLLIWPMVGISLYLGYLPAFEKSDRYAVVQQFWGCCSGCFWISNAICRQFRWDEIQYLLTWFKEVQSRTYPLEYEEIVRKKFKRIIYILNNIVKWVLNLFCFYHESVFNGYISGFIRRCLASAWWYLSLNQFSYLIGNYLFLRWSTVSLPRISYLFTRL